MGSERLSFGRFELNPVTYELTRDDELVPLQQKPARLLALLASRPGELITREEIHAAVWGEGTFLEFDPALNFSMKQIRTALEDHADHPEFVETLPRRGYRFVADVRPAAGPSVPAGSVPWRWAGAAFAALLAGGVIASRSAMRPPEMSSAPEATVSQLTTLLGEEFHPSLSPDGSQVAFVWSGENGDSGNVYVGDINPDTLKLAGPPRRLTSDTDPACCSAWSPDASWIAFVHSNGEVSSIQLVSAQGGPVRELTDLSLWFGTALTWSADGSRLVYSDRRTGDAPYSVFQITLDTLEIEPLTKAPQDALGDAFPALSAGVAASGDARRQEAMNGSFWPIWSAGATGTWWRTGSTSSTRGRRAVRDSSFSNSPRE